MAAETTTVRYFSSSCSRRWCFNNELIVGSAPQRIERWCRGPGLPLPLRVLPLPLSPTSRTPAYPETPGARGHTQRRDGPGRGAGRRSESAPSAPRSLQAGKKGGGGRVRMWRGGREPARRRAAARWPSGRAPDEGRARLGEGRRLRTSSARRGRVSGERRPAPQSASSGPAGSWWPNPGLRGVGLAGPLVNCERRAASTWRCVGPAATRAPYTWGAARRRRGRGRRRRPGPAREGVGRVCGKFEAGRDTPGPGWRPWGDGVWRCARPGGSLIGAKLPWTAEGLGRFPTSLECRFENLGENLLLKRRSMEKGIEEV